MIGPKTAFALYALLLAAALLTLHGMALELTLIIVLGLGAKTFLDYLRRRSE